MPTAKKKIDYFPVNRLDILILTKEDSQDYKENLKIELLLPVNDEGHCKKFVPWKTKSVFTLNDPSKSNEKCHYHLHPKLILNSTDEPVAVICTNCAESITHNKIPKNSIASREDFCIAVELQNIKNHSFFRVVSSLPHLRYSIRIPKIAR